MVRSYVIGKECFCATILRCGDFAAQLCACVYVEHAEINAIVYTCVSSVEMGFATPANDFLIQK